MPVTVTDFQENVSRYLQLISKHDVFIMQDGRVIAKLTRPSQGKNSCNANFPPKLTKRAESEEIAAAINSLVGVIPDEGMTLLEYKTEL